jgi:hypothetical protein
MHYLPPLIPDHGQTGAGSLSDLTKQLRYHVYMKKSKNVDILRLAAEVL